MRSFFKTVLDTTSRFKYLQYAYKNMANWMTVGTEDELKLKKFIHRHLALPTTLHGTTAKAAQALLRQFAFQYVDALLRYASDDLKESMSPVNCS